MAKITNAQAVKFCNEQIRILADLAARYYYTAKQVQDFASANELKTVFSADPTMTVDDGSDVDGRSSITGADVTAVIERATDFTTDMEANKSVKLYSVLKTAVNTK